MKYTAKGTHNRHFDLLDANSFSLGKLDYTSWFTITSEITLQNGTLYSITPSNIWHTSIEVKSVDNTIATLKFNWKGQIVISMTDGQSYMFKRKGFFNMHFALFNEHEHELVVVNQKFELAKLTFNYFIETDDNYKEGKDIVLLLLLIYCANYMHNMHAG